MNSTHLPKPCLSCGHIQDLHGGEKDCMACSCFWFVDADKPDANED